MGSLRDIKSKALLPLNSVCSVLSQTLRSLVAANVLEGIVVACKPQDQQEINGLLTEICPDLDCFTVEGGAERQESVYNALVALEGKSDKVLVHDGVRPLCPVHLIRAVVERADEDGAAILAVPSKSTLKSVIGNINLVVKETVPRDTIWEAQTPQVFPYSILRAAHERAIKDAIQLTDDSSLVERLGHEVHVVKGSFINIKITTQEDFQHVQMLCGSG
jgi:2-C-methyl-D-erythritol 4-phosphate cytidylyltransferase